MRLFPFLSIYFILQFLGSFPVLAQNSFQKDAPLDPGEAIHLLKEGALVVRLKTNTRKINEIREKLASGKLNQVHTQRMERFLDQTRDETAGIHSQVINAFNDHYTFSKVYFIPDTNYTKLLSGTTRGLFYDNNVTINREIHIEEAFLVFAQGNHEEEWYIMDTDNVQIQAPFPSYHRLSGLNTLLLTSGKQDKIVQKVNKKLHRYWDKQQ